MLNIKSKADRVNPHAWFAWYPVLAEKKGTNGVAYHYVWLKTVQRRFVRAANMSQWVHEIS